MVTTNFILILNGSNLLPETKAYIAAGGITDPVIIQAANTLFTGLINNNLWPLYHAVYPCAGGTALSNSINAKAPGTYNLSYVGGITHNANGMTFDGATGYALTGINPSVPVFGAQDNFGLSVYVRNNLNAGCAIGGGLLSPVRITQIYPRLAGMSDIAINSANSDGAASADSRGQWDAHRTASNVIKGFKNGAVVVNSTRASVTPASAQIGIGANNRTAATDFSAFNIAFATLSQGLTDAQVAIQNTLIQEFNTALSRNV